MVYDGTLNGLNNFPWSPHCEFTTVASTLRIVDEGTYMGDRYIGEMFLNFILSEEVGPFCGVYVTNVKTEEDWKNRLWGWEI